jgi:hypothetical protein
MYVDEVMSIYTYDADLTIDWNDPYRHTKKKLLNMTAGANASAVNANAATQGFRIYTVSSHFKSEHTYTYIHTHNTQSSQS